MLRTLLDCAVEATQATSEPTHRFALVAVDLAALAAVGAREFARTQIAAGRTYETAGELAAAGADMRTLALVDLPQGLNLDRLWLIDVWRLLRKQGSGVDLQGAHLRGAQLQGACLGGADLANADLVGADLEKADLSCANLTGANLAGSVLSRANLRGANLTEAELCRADLRHADLRESCCPRAGFRGADLWEAVISNLDLSQAFVDGIELERVGNFDGKMPT